MRNKTYVIVEMKRINPVAFHVVKTGDDALKAANQVRSIESFRHRSHKSSELAHLMDHWYKITDAIPTQLNHLPIHMYDDMWHFYNTIGYDYKRQTFT